MADVRDVSIESGFDLIFFSQLDEDGYAVGGTGVCVAGDEDGSPALRLDGAQTVDLSSPQPEVLTALGDDIPMVTERFEGTELPAGALAVASKDILALSYATGMPTRTVAGGLQVVRDTSGNEAPNLVMIFQRRSKSWAAGYKGVKQRSGLYALNVNLTPVGSPYEQRSFQPYNWYINTSKASRHIWGETLQEATDGKLEASIVEFTSPNAMHLHSFRGDGAQATFNCAYTPISPATGGIYVTVEGVPQTYGVDYTVAGKVITFAGGSIPALNERVEVIYQFDRSELS